MKLTSEVWAALIVAASAVLVAWMQTRTHREVKQARAAADLTVAQTEQTSNGFARTMKESVKKIEEHLERQDRRRDRIERWTAQQIVSFDDRLLHIEDAIVKYHPEERNPDDATSPPDTST